MQSKTSSASVDTMKMLTEENYRSKESNYHASENYSWMVRHYATLRHTIKACEDEKLVS